MQIIYIRFLVQCLSHSEYQQVVGIIISIIPGPSERLDLPFTCFILLSFSRNGRSQSRPRWGQNGSWRRRQKSAADCRSCWRGGRGRPSRAPRSECSCWCTGATWGPQPDSETPPGLGETGKSPEAERGRQRWLKMGPFLPDVLIVHELGSLGLPCASSS